MRSFAVVLVFMFYPYAGKTQSTTLLHRKINRLERRYELDSTSTRESFRELWDYVYQEEETCCQVNAVSEYDQNVVDTLSDKEEDIGKTEEEIKIIRYAFIDEKKLVRNRMDSFEKMMTEYNRTSSAEIEKLRMETINNKKGVCTCSTKWVKIFENGPNGEVLFGDRNDLIQASLSGSSVKILADKLYVTTVQSLIPVKGHLMAQALFHVSISNRKFRDNAYWWFVIASTTGHWYMSRYNVGEHVSRGDNEIKYGMEWFIRRPCDINPALRILSDGTAAYGNIKTVITAVRNGYPVQISSLKTGYTFPADNLEVSGDHVAVQSLWHLSQEFSTDKHRMKFQKNAYWYFTIWATTGMKQMSRWNVGEHRSRGRTSDNALTDWFEDPCWSLAYRHSSQGDIIEGNKTLLIDSIRRGHRARIVYKDFSFEPNIIFIADSEIHALSMDSVSKVAFDQFEENVNWVWRSASTDGTIQIVNTPVGSSKNKRRTEKVQMAWFVDTRRWKETVSIAASGKVSGGSKTDLLHYVKQGADVRFAVKDSNDKDYVYLQPDNINLVERESSLTAMHIRQASFYPEILPSWIFTMTNTEGLRDTSIWKLGEHKEISHKEHNVHTVWFISE